MAQEWTPRVIESNHSVGTAMSAPSRRGGGPGHVTAPVQVC